MSKNNYFQNSQQINQIVDILLVALRDQGIYVYHRATSTSSVYLKFKDEQLRSLTVRDHTTIPKYRYKWNIIIGYRGTKKVMDRGVPRYMYNEKQLHQCIDHIKNYANTIIRNKENSLSLTKSHDDPTIKEDC